jgi:hypothetical protein
MEDEKKPKTKLEPALQQNMLIKEKWKIEKLIGTTLNLLIQRKRNIWRNIFSTGRTFRQRSSH